MTVHSDLQRAIAMAEASKGQYLLFATDSEDEKATTVFQDMAADMERHVKILESRRDYLEQHNNLIQTGGKQEDNKQKDQKQ